MPAISVAVPLRTVSPAEYLQEREEQEEVPPAPEPGERWAFPVSEQKQSPYLPLPKQPRKLKASRAQLGNLLCPFQFPVAIARRHQCRWYPTRRKYLRLADAAPVARPFGCLCGHS